MDLIGWGCPGIVSISRFSTWLLNLWIDLPLLSGLAVACLVSWSCVDRLIQKHYETLTATLKNEPGLVTSEDILPSEQRTEKPTWPPLRARVGRTERLLYIYAIASGVYALLSGWIVLKAFFGWIYESKLPELVEEGQRHESALQLSRRKLVGFYLYIYGNALSLIAAVVLTYVGLTIAAALRLLPAVCHPSG
jgi:hypothetical protein